MSTRAVSSFQVTDWKQEPYDDGHGGPILSRAKVDKSFQGDLTGESVAQLLMCQADQTDLAAGAGYIASERVVGNLAGRSGTFMMQHWGLSGGGQPQRTGGNIVPGSGTGELAGLTGSVEIMVDAAGAHTLTLSYELP